MNEQIADDTGTEIPNLQPLRDLAAVFRAFEPLDDSPYQQGLAWAYKDAAIFLENAIEHVEQNVREVDEARLLALVHERLSAPR